VSAGRARPRPVILDWWGVAFKISRRNYERWLAASAERGSAGDPSEFGGRRLGDVLQVTDWTSEECVQRLRESLEERSRP
jgi:hypothetical protein